MLIHGTNRIAHGPEQFAAVLVRDFAPTILRDAKLPIPGAGVCLSPWVDMEGIGKSMQSKAAIDPVVQRESLLGIAAAYLGGQNPRSPPASALYPALQLLPPLLLPLRR